MVAAADPKNHAMLAALARGGYRAFRWRRDQASTARSEATPWRVTQPMIDPAHVDQPPVEPRSLLTPRLSISPLVAADASEMVAVLKHPALYRYIGGAPPSLAELTEHYQHWAIRRSPDGTQVWWNWVVRTLEGTPVGWIQATVTDDGRRAEMAWVTGRAYWGRGFATEAANAVAAWLLTVGVVEITANIHPGNQASAAVARMIGLNPTQAVHDGEQVWQRHAQHHTAP